MKRYEGKIADNYEKYLSSPLMVGFKSNFKEEEIIDEILSYMESRFPVGEPKLGAFAANGEPYVSLTCGGIKPEGDLSPTFSSSWLKAKEHYIKEFDKYCEGKCGTLYFRMTPRGVSREMHSHLKYGHRYVAICSRILVSDKPALTDEQWKETFGE